MASSAVGALMCTLATAMPSSSGIPESSKGTNITGHVSKLTSQRCGNTCEITEATRTCNTSTIATFQYTVPDAYDGIVLCCPNKHHGCDWTGSLTNAIDHIRYDCLFKITSLNQDHTMPVILTMTAWICGEKK